MLDSDRNVLVAFIFAAGFALLAGWLANRWRVRVLMWLTALGGAGMALNGLGRAFDSLNAVRRPSSAGEQTVTFVLWIGLALLGWWSQRHVSRRALRRDQARS